MRPRIGITLDWQKEGTYSKRPHHALRCHYFDIVAKAGGLPFGIPYIPEALDQYIENLDGFVIPGGFFASPDHWYISSSATSPYEPSPRLQFDLDIINLALNKDIPILGICAGMQLMGGLRGCKMTDNIVEYLNLKIDHLNEKPAEEAAHLVKISPGTLLEKIIGQDELAVNSAHKEAIVEVAKGVTVNAISEDGVIEGIEIASNRFAVGVQWHPEFCADEKNQSFKLFEALVKAASLA